MADSHPATRADALDSGAFYGLDELLAMAGERLGEEITPRTVRLYATEGLIDRPGKDGRRAVYGQRHLLQLLIRSLARRGLSLTAIAPLAAGSDGELLEQLLQMDEPAALASSGGPADPATAQQQKALACLGDSSWARVPSPPAATAPIRSSSKPLPKPKTCRQSKKCCAFSDRALL